MSEEKKLPRGVRNCNPGNIRRPPKKLEEQDRFDGEIRPSRDPDFRTFVKMAYGYRAMFRILRTYKNNYKLNTLEQMIYRWAPPTVDDNKTEDYVRNVSEWSGIAPDQIVDVSNMTIMCRLVAAMSRQENGIPADENEVRDGWILL